MVAPWWPPGLWPPPASPPALSTWACTFIATVSPADALAALEGRKWPEVRGRGEAGQAERAGPLA